MSDFSEQPKTPTKQIGQNYVGGMATSQGRTQSGGGAFANSKQTPSGNRTKEKVPPPDEKKLDKRREWLYNELKDCGEPMDFNVLLGNLGLPLVDDPFKEDAPKLFQLLAECAPYLNKTKMAQTRREGSTKLQPSGPFKGSSFFGAEKEKAVTSYFQRLVALMHDEATKHNKRISKTANLSQLVPEFIYDIADHQSKEVPGSSHKMDVVLFYASRPKHINNVHIIVEAKLANVGDPMDEKTFAQIADYQYCIWKKQRTRAFVPVLLVHGSQLDLVVFARGHWYRVWLGSLCHGRQIIDTQDVKDVRLAMVRLYYLITLPSERFGHICDVSQGQQHLRFVKTSGVDSVLAAVESHVMATVDLSDLGDLLKIGGYVERFVHPRGRLAHIFRTTFQKQKAILKLSWTPVDRMPEGAVYELLENANVKGMPRVFACGLVRTSLFGYRLEYLVLEDCGSTIQEYLLATYKGELGSGELYNIIRDVVWQTLRCLARARVKANVLHRDISAGNIMIDSDGVVRIIDWGYAKVIDDASFDINERATRDRRALLDATANRWRYDDHEVLQNEDAHDPLTGTPLYMSIPVLAGAKERGLADDVESLFYVILHVLTKLQATPDSAACGFDQHDNKTQIMVRAGCLALERHFLRFFGISSCSDDLRRLLCDLRKFLFVNSDGCIASGLIVDPTTPRGAVDLLQPYVNADTMGLLLRKDEAALTPMKSAVQLPSFRPPSSSSSGPLDEARYSENAGVSIGGLGMSSRSLGKRAREAEGTEESDGGSLGSVSKRSKSQG